MYAECPHCHAIFRVTEEILARAAGKVRCGECGVVFEVADFHAVNDAEPTTDEILVPTSTPAPEDDAIEVVPSDVDRPVIEPADSGLPLENGLPSSFDDAPAAPLIKDEPAEEDFELIIEEREPVQDDGDRRSPLHQWVWGLLAVCLVLLLLAQILVAKRNAVLQAVPAMRPVVTGLCQVAGCSVDPRRDLNQIELASHSVFSHPDSDDALMIRASIVNQAAFAQPYPVIDLTLTDIQGRAVASRRFEPSEYLDDPESLPPMMEPGQPVPLLIEVLDPGKNALAFEFEFL